MLDFKDACWKNAAIMTVIAKGMTDAEMKGSADYFASVALKRGPRIVEATNVPKTFVGPGNMSFVSTTDKGTQPFGQRCAARCPTAPT